MAFTNYIVLDGKYYKTKADNWFPEGMNPSTVRALLSGALDGTYGPATFKMWNGEIMVDITRPSASYGTPAELKASLAKRTSLSFTDHYGDSYTVHVQGWKERSLSPNWEQSENTVYFAVSLLGKAV